MIYYDKPLITALRKRVSISFFVDPANSLDPAVCVCVCVCVLLHVSRRNCRGERNRSFVEWIRLRYVFCMSVAYIDTIANVKAVNDTLHNKQAYYITNKNVFVWFFFYFTHVKVGFVGDI